MRPTPRELSGRLGKLETKLETQAAGRFDPIQQVLSRLPDKVLDALAVAVEENTEDLSTAVWNMILEVEQGMKNDYCNH